MSLTNRIAIVTGGSRGVGAGIAAELAQRSADVTITYTTNLAAAEVVAQQICSLRRRSTIIQANQTTPDVGDIVLKDVQGGFGVVSMDILVLNGGDDGADADVGLGDGQVGQVRAAHLLSCG
jgi:3-oxoacyl-[acyl-carrier protein] reductase